MSEHDKKQEGKKEFVYLSDIIWDQIALLRDWNKENIKSDPEQARKNFETILQAGEALRD